MEIVIPIDDEPWERILEVEGVAQEGSEPNMNYGGLPSPGEPPRFEVTHVEWHEYDPLDGEGDPVEFYEEHEAKVHDQALEQASDHAQDRRYEEPPGI